MLKDPDWSSIFAPKGVLLQEGELIRRTNLSRTLASIAEEGANAFYSVRLFYTFEILLQNLSSYTSILRGQSQRPSSTKHDQQVAF